MLDPNVKALFGTFYTTLKDVTVIDDSTVRITTKSPDPLVLNRLAMGALWVFPAELFKKQGAETFFQHPSGQGPSSS